MKKIGVLDLQGGVAEHLAHLRLIAGVEPVAVKYAQQFLSLDGLIIPGGESTTLRRLLDIFALKEEILQLAARSIPIWGTCAGLILLANKISGDNKPYLKLINIEVQRNGYGNQLASFFTTATAKIISELPLPFVFIRAPKIISWGTEVEVIAEVNGDLVAARQGHILVTSFHPELSSDLSFHKYFVSMTSNS